MNSSLLPPLLSFCQNTFSSSPSVGFFVLVHIVLLSFFATATATITTHHEYGTHAYTRCSVSSPSSSSRVRESFLAMIRVRNDSLMFICHVQPRHNDNSSSLDKSSTIIFRSEPKFLMFEYTQCRANTIKKKKKKKTSER